VTAYNKFKPSYDGSTFPTYNAAAAGDQVVSAQGGILVVKTGATGTTVTLTTPGSLPNGDAYPDKAIVIGTNSERWIPIGPEYCDASGLLSLSWSSTTTVTWACINPLA
jgi:hypothetical protein